MYYLKCSICDHKEKYIGKTVDDNVVLFKSRINQHISDCRTGNTTCKFPIYVYPCAIKNKFLKEPYFQLNISMKLKDSRQLELKNHFHRKGDNAINCPEQFNTDLTPSRDYIFIMTPWESLLPSNDGRWSIIKQLALIAFLMQKYIYIYIYIYI